MSPPSVTPFGQQLRTWRVRRGFSQLALATEAGTTSRHLSFLETGRSRPGRELVLRLASALQVPLREQNALLASAGLAAAFPARAMEDAPMRPIQQVLDRVLRMQEPYPAWVIARGMRFVASNRAAERLFPGLCALSPENIVDLWFGPGPYRELVENWQDVAWAALSTLRREAERSSDEGLFALVRRAEELARALPPPGIDAQPELPLACPRLKIGGRTLQTVTTVLRFDSSLEVTSSELRVELVFPADAESEAFFRELAEQERVPAASLAT